jgi:GNAT superfamily N-acetyltransferase
MDAGDAADFREFTRVATSSTARSPAPTRPLTREEPPHYQADGRDPSCLGGDRDGAFIGRVGVDLPLEDGSRNAFWLVELLAAHHGRGIGSAGYRLIEQTARDTGARSCSRGRSIRMPTEIRWWPRPGGSIPRDHAARFYLRHGYTLEQIERQSVLILAGADATVASAAEAGRHPPATASSVAGRDPGDAHVDAYAWMKSDVDRCAQRRSRLR